MGFHRQVGKDGDPYPVRRHMGLYQWASRSPSGKGIRLHRRDREIRLGTHEVDNSENETLRACGQVADSILQRSASTGD